MRNHFQPQNLCDIQNLSAISVSRDDEVHRKVDITLKDPDKEVTYQICNEADQKIFILIFRICC